MILRPLALIALLLSAPAAHAACLDAASISKGVAFTRADGRPGVAQAKGGGIEIDYAAGSDTAWTDERSTRLGIYENTWSYMPADDYYVGGGPGGYWEYRRGGKDAAPVPGSTWSTTLRSTLTRETGTEYGPEVTRSRIKATYSFLDAQSVTLSGCKYTAIPVELRGADAKLIRRWMYFPDLGFGLETRMASPETGRDLKLGLTAMKPL
jgi:hypothetical protein